MTGIVVEKSEQPKSVHKTRSHPVISIVGELANNLLISGVIRSCEPGEPQAEVVKLRDPRSRELCSVVTLLQNLSESHVFELADNDRGRIIKIYPRPSTRREGN